MGRKPFWKSKTFWFNVLVGAAAMPDSPIGAALPSSYTVPIVAGANLLLRLVTKQPIAVRPAGDE